MKNSNITTIKLHKETKQRLENLKEYKRETYEDILQKIFDILNICKFNPERARSKLIIIDKQKRKQNKFMKEKQISQEKNII